MTMRFPLLASLPLLALAACTPDLAPTGELVERHLDDSAFAALPSIAVTDGPLVCTSIGDDKCPLRSAAANRLDAERIALWEPGAVVRVWRPGDSLGTPVGRAGGEGSQYRLAIAIRADGDRYQLITADSGWRQLEIDRDGTLRNQVRVPVYAPLTLVGYVGSQPVRHQMRGWTTGEGGRLTVTLLEHATDTTGRELLSTPVRWLIGGTASMPPLPPLVAANPSWALAPGHGIVWSPGDAFVVEYRDVRGDPRWRLTGPPAPPVSELDLAVRDSVVREASRLLPFEDLDYASMRDRSDSTHPAVSSLAIAPTGEVIVGLAAIPSRDSTDYLRIARDGEPLGRFALDRRTRILLVEGDSMLVHRPTEGEPWEVRWMRLDERR